MALLSCTLSSVSTALCDAGIVHSKLSTRIQRGGIVHSKLCREGHRRQHRPRALGPLRPRGRDHPSPRRPLAVAHLPGPGAFPPGSAAPASPALRPGLPPHPLIRPRGTRVQATSRPAPQSSGSVPRRHMRSSGQRAAPQTNTPPPQSRGFSSAQHSSKRQFSSAPAPQSRRQ